MINTTFKDVEGLKYEENTFFDRENNKEIKYRTLYVMGDDLESMKLKVDKKCIFGVQEFVSRKKYDIQAVVSETGIRVMSIIKKG